MTFFKRLQLLFLISFCFSLNCDAGLFSCFRKAKANPEETSQQININNEDIEKIIENFEYKDIGKVKEILNELLMYVRNSNQINLQEKQQVIELLGNLGKKLDKVSVGLKCERNATMVCRLILIVLIAIIFIAACLTHTWLGIYYDPDFDPVALNCKELTKDYDEGDYEKWCKVKHGKSGYGSRWIYCKKCLKQATMRSNLSISGRILAPILGFLGLALGGLIAIPLIKLFHRKIKKWSLGRLIKKLEKILASKEFKLVGLDENV